MVALVAAVRDRDVKVDFFSPLLLSSLESSATKVYEPDIRAHLKTASQFCEQVVGCARP